MTMYSPRFCYANYAKESLLTVATNDDGKIKLVDRNAERRYISTSGDETATITLTLDAATDIDTIIFLNTNMLNFECKYDTTNDFTPTVTDENASVRTVNIADGDNNLLVDGSANYVVAAGIATSVYNNFYFKVSTESATTVTLTVTETTDSNPFRMGQMIVTKQLYELSSSGRMVISPRVRQYLKELSDGTTNKVYVRQTNSYDLTLNNVSAQERANLELLYDINKRSSFYFIARPAMDTDYFDGLCGHVEWVNEFDLNNYYNDIKNNGFTGVMKLEQSSGIK